VSLQPPPQTIFCYIKMVSFYAFPVIFLNDKRNTQNFLLKKGTLIKRAGVRTPWTPLDPPLIISLYMQLAYMHAHNRHSGHTVSITSVYTM